MFEVSGSGFRVQGSGFSRLVVSSSWFPVFVLRGSGFPCSRFRVRGFVFRFPVRGSMFSGFGFRDFRGL